MVKNPLANSEGIRDGDWIPESGRSSEEGMTAHPISMPGELKDRTAQGLQSIGSQRLAQN